MDEFTGKTQVCFCRFPLNLSIKSNKSVYYNLVGEEKIKMPFAKLKLPEEQTELIEQVI